MKTYTVTLYGNRRGALINADYMVSETTDYILAKARIKANGGWGSIGEQSSFERAIAYNEDFIKEVSGQGLNIKRGFISIQ
tara:strand:- start:339 stop:581 length:243 start_codon:yes stop_codon:yes gene_type:complete